MKILKILILILLFTNTTPANADSKAENAAAVKLAYENAKKAQEERCKVKTTSTLNIKLMNTDDSFKALSQYVTTLRETLLAEAQKLEISDLKTSNSNFSITEANNRYGQQSTHKYRLNGSLQLTTTEPEKAILFAEKISEKDLSVTYSENTRGGYCR